MAIQIKKSNPTSPGRRFRSWTSRDHLHKGDPYAPLLEKKKQRSGRNNQGKITSRHRGGGHKKHYRLIDFNRNKDKRNGCSDISFFIYCRCNFNKMANSMETKPPSKNI